MTSLILHSNLSLMRVKVECKYDLHRLTPGQSGLPLGMKSEPQRLNTQDMKLPEEYLEGGT